MRSALAGPGAGFGSVERYPSLAGKAAILAYQLLKGHPCADGNKRLALILTDAFLEANGCEVEATAVALDQKFRHAAASPSSEWEATVLELQEWFGEIMRPLTEEA